MSALATPLTWILFVFVAGLNIRQALRFAPAGPQRKLLKTTWQADIVGMKYALFGAVGFGLLYFACSADRVGVWAVGILFLNWCPLVSIGLYAKNGNATRKAVAGAVAFSSYMGLLASLYTTPRGMLAEVHELAIAAQIGLGSTCLLAVALYMPKRASRLLVVFICVLPVTLAITFLTGTPSPTQPWLDRQVGPAYADTIPIRADALAKVTTPGTERFDIGRVSLLGVEFLLIDGHTAPDLTELRATFRRYMDGYVHKYHRSENELKETWPHGPPVVQADAEALGLFNDQDYAAIRTKYGRSVFSAQSETFHPLVDDLVVYSYMQVGEVGEDALLKVAENALSNLPLPGSVDAVEKLLRLDRFFTRIGRDELREPLALLAKRCLYSTWSRHDAWGRSGFYAGIEQTDIEGYFRPLGISGTKGTPLGLMAMERFGLMAEFDLIGIEKNVRSLSYKQGSGDAPRFNLAAAGALSFILSHPAYAAQLKTPKVMSTEDQTLFDIRKAETESDRLARESRASEESPLTIHNSRWLLAILLMAVLNLGVTSRAPLETKDEDAA